MDYRHANASSIDSDKPHRLAATWLPSGLVVGVLPMNEIANLSTLFVSAD
jgi:hypothetical protein